ncbi:leucine-rich_repeat domain-containing protein [Hexamita inflata]|uniref:Partial n=1 Tax=Hexamita inflata TaxID=28002 RepID=A0AA86NP56_9EUKA|nr:leucine-rich repeat domain-containing protein [Hexamita inflata]
MTEELDENYENTMVQKYQNQITNQELHLAQNSAKSIQFVEKFDITSLTIKYCFQLDFDASLSQVTQLNINFCQLKETRYIQKMTQLFDLSLTNITLQFPLIDIQFAQNLVNLRHLNLSTNKINNLSSLQELTNLQKLELWHNQIVDVTPLAKLTQLTELILGENKISDISCLHQLNNLQKCDMQSNKLRDISIIKKWTSLQVLYIGSNDIEDISVFSELHNLVQLSVSNNLIKSVQSFRKLNKLKYLGLFGNILTDISPIRMLKSLEELDISVNPVISIQELDQLSNLVKLDVNNCSVVDISVLNGLNNLTYLNVENNFITELFNDNKSRYNQYLTFGQWKPTQEQILFASKLKHISTQNRAIESINVKGHQMNQTIQKNKLKVNKVLTDAVKNQYCFMNRVVQQLNQVKVEVLQ